MCKMPTSVNVNTTKYTHLRNAFSVHTENMTFHVFMYLVDHNGTISPSIQIEIILMIPIIVTLKKKMGKQEFETIQCSL